MRQRKTIQQRLRVKAALWLLCGVVLSACGGNKKDEPQLFIVTANAGSGGSISPGTRSVQGGQTTSFTLSVNEGYSIASVTGCNGSLSGNTYTTGAITAACSVQASFNLNSYTVTATAGEGGSISPETVLVSHGAIAELTITAESGYTLSTITGCDGSLTDNTYRTAPVTSACSVAATFAKQVIAGELPEVAGLMTASVINTDEVYFHADTQGFIPVTGHTASPTQAPPAGWSFPYGLFDFTAVQRVAGGSAVITLSYPVALPENFSYYKFGPSTAGAAPGWYVLPASHYEVSADRKTLTLTIFDGQLGDSDGEINGIIKDPGGPALQQQYNVIATAGEGGSISPGSAVVNYGGSTSFSVTPQTGFSIASVTGCNGSLSGNTYTTGAITAACSVTASFSQNSYTVSASADEGGSISPGSALVNHGSSTSFSVTPQTGFSIASVTGCNGSLSGNTYTTGAITGACSVSASFSQNSFTVSASAGEGGAISPASRSVLSGQTTTFTVTADTGFSIASVTGCNGSLSGNTYTTGAITSACSVTASFSQNSFTVSATAGEGGAISPASRSALSGQTTTFTVTADTGYSIASVTGCNGSLSGNTYTTGAINGACSVSASFSQNSYMVTAIANAGGQITPGSLSVLHGQTAQFSVVADDNHRIVEVTGCGGSLAGETYTTGVITAACTIDASFAFVPIGGLNDTGIDWCANNSTNNLDCPVAGFEGQDGEFGRDAMARAGTLTKIGGGAAGFDYTKIAADGSVLPIQDVAWDVNGTEAAGSQWSCVRDNVTGLIWEVKTTDGGLRDMSHTYTWYNPDSNTNGGSAGTQNGGSCVGSDCDTHAFVQEVNSQGLCGANDWRMPSIQELLSVVHNGRHQPSIDSDYFPNLQSTYFSHGSGGGYSYVWYWSSSPSARNEGFAWFTAFHGAATMDEIIDSNHRGDMPKSTSMLIRLVRSER